VLAVHYSGLSARAAVALAGRAAMTTALVLFAPAATAAMRLVRCSPTQLTAEAYAVLDGGGGGGGGSDATMTVVPILESNPYYVCWAAGGGQTPVGALAIIALVLYVAALPALTLAWVWHSKGRPIPRSCGRYCPLSRPAAGSDRTAGLKSNTKALASEAEDSALVASPPPHPASAVLSSAAAAAASVDPLLAPFVADYIASAWYFRHVELVVTITLAALDASWELPTTAGIAGAKAALTIVAVLALCGAVIVVRPYPAETAWKGPVKVLLLLMTALAACVNLAAALPRLLSREAYDAASSAAFVTGASYVLFTLSFLAALVLLLGALRSLYVSAGAEQREIDARARQLVDYSVAYSSSSRDPADKGTAKLPVSASQRHFSLANLLSATGVGQSARASSLSPNSYSSTVTNPLAVARSSTGSTVVAGSGASPRAAQVTRGGRPAASSVAGSRVADVAGGPGLQLMTNPSWRRGHLPVAPLGAREKDAHAPVSVGGASAAAPALHHQEAAGVGASMH
jgi:hypothetical protein